MKKLSLLAAVLAAFCSSAAQAESVSSAWVGPVSFTLADLDLNDGITPSIQFYNAESSVSGQIYNYDGVIYSSLNSYSNFVPGVYTSYSGSVSSALSNVSSSLSGTSYADTTVAAQGSAIGTGGSPATAGSYSGFALGRSYFTLSENTAITFSANAQASASAGAQDYVHAGAYIIAQYTYPSTGLTSSVADFIIFNNGNTLESINQSQSRQLTFTLNNPFAEIVYGDLFHIASVEGYSFSDYVPPSSVPAPAALPLMLSGLGVIGVAVRRRKFN